MFLRIKKYNNNKPNIFWFGAFIWNYLIKRSKQLSSIHPGLCIIHGDTLSTLLGLLWSKNIKWLQFIWKVACLAKAFKTISRRNSKKNSF